VLQISPIPAFDDNYIWLLQRSGYSGVAVVDPGDEDPVLELLQREGLKLEAILLTHKHGDHTGGVRELLAAYPGIPVYGPSHEPVPVVTRPLSDGERIRLSGLDLELEVLELPGHTEGHVAYLVEGNLFCGDTLFSCGCGRVFSGTHEQLHASLQRIASLPPQTNIYCAHEYTLDNIGFAKGVEPESRLLLQREEEAKRLRARGAPTVPSTLQLELDTNPFLRCDEPTVVKAAERHAGHGFNTSSEVFIAIRGWKDKEYD
jgi:hydroxyacylglutathione hydrolase